MKVLHFNELPEERIVVCPNGGFTSHRLLLSSDNVGYTMTHTIVHPGKPHYWHYKNHIESCYCISGNGLLKDARTGEVHRITPGTTYVLNENDPHEFEALEETVLVCVFNPPLVGSEVHEHDGSYSTPYKSPVYGVRSVPISKVRANDYNPNAVAPPEMELLETSIWEDGYTQPVVVVHDTENDEYVVVDGFHRFKILRDCERIRDRENGLLPVVVLDKEMGDRMASTIRHNRARGTHNIELMSNIVSELVEMGKGDRWICQHIGMSPDELLRMKQITGLAALFTNTDFSSSWEPEDYEENVA